ncbi:hypothetical protein VN97_g6419 [Penicillium thymicola]|uniref:Uncharacterized protein n=1 Tax=Penicillium thymicola TaxID=293382 RepID=A0AAI9X7R2_PENTH|nr:hypothetical protein VN97_g6419 [Penicillium thymicola]
MDWMHVYIVGAAVLVFALVGLVLLVSSQHIKVANTGVGPYLKFIWANFIKPHDQKAGGQQDALESFYKTQAAIYDATRRRLLCGREDMLGLVAAQLKYKTSNKEVKAGKAVWVDVGGGTG